MSQKIINRRKFLQMSAAGVAGLVIASCAPAAAPVEAPEAEAPAEAPEAAPPTPTPRVLEEATATPVPTLASTKYNEAPALAELVAAGKLPPVDERLPVNPLVLAGVDGIGKYGGRLRKFWPGAGWNGHFLEEQYGHSALRWIDDGLGIAPGICDEWAPNADNSEWTLHFREGLKWSDGQPCGVDDVMFWWDDLTVKGGTENPDAIPDFGSDANGKLAEFIKVDDFTLMIKYGTPSPLCAKRLAMWVNANIGPRWIAPKHYLEQFHPKYSDQTSFELFNEKASVFTNPEMPTLTAWMLTKYEAGKAFTAERNPYYYAVDTEGNQLPYIDGEDWIGVQDRQVELLQIRQGTVDHIHFHSLTIADISTLLESQESGNYDVVLWDSGSGTGMMYFWNYDYPDTTPEEKVIHDLFRNPKFKQAMSFALDRATIQKTVYYNTGFLTTGTMSPKAFEFNFNAEAQAFGQKAFNAYVAYDPEKAKALLAEIGYDPSIEVRIDLPGDAGKECTDVLQIAEQNWKAVGLNIIINQVTGTAFDALWHSGKGAIHTNWEVGDGPDHLLYPSWVVPNEPDRWAPLCGELYRSLGTERENSEADKSPWDRAPVRYNKEDPQYKGTPIEKIHGLYNQAIVEPDEVKRAQLVWEMWQIHIDEGPFFIGTVANYPRIIIKSKNLMNVPTRDQLKMGGFVNPWIIPYPAVTNTETWSYK